MPSLRKLSLNEVRLIYTINYFRLSKTLKRLDDVNMLSLCDEFYKDYKYVWIHDMIGTRDFLYNTAKNFANNIYKDCYLDPSDKNGDSSLRKLIDIVDYYSNVASRVENLYQTYRLFSYHALSESEKDYNTKFMIKNEKNFVKTISKNQSDVQAQNMIEIIDKIIDNEDKIKVLNSRILNKATSIEDRTKCEKYYAIYKNENDDLAKKFYKYLPELSSKEDDWLFGK